MENLKRILCNFYWPVALIMIFTSLECNAQSKKMSTRDLTKKSNSIVYGKCSGVKCKWNQAQDIIVTEVTIVPEGYVKGNLGGQVVVTVPGGRIGDIIYQVSEMPVFEPGEEVFAFIYRHPSGKNLVTGGFHGKMRIEKDKATGKRMVKSKRGLTQRPPHDLTGVDVKSAATGKTLLEDFIKEVEGYLK